MKYLLLSLLCTSCTLIAPSTPKQHKEFHYQDYVKVVKGFYMGCNGYIDSISKQWNNAYNLHLVCKDAQGMPSWPTVTLDADDIEVTKHD